MLGKRFTCNSQIYFSVQVCVCKYPHKISCAHVKYFTPYIMSTQHYLHGRKQLYIMK